MNRKLVAIIGALTERGTLYSWLQKMMLQIDRAMLEEAKGGR